MKQRIAAFLQEQVSALNTGDADALVRLMGPPVPVFDPAGSKFLMAEGDVRESMQTTAAAIARIGASRLSYRIVEISEREGTGTVSCLVELRYENDDGEVLRATRLRQYIEPEGARARLVMVEYLSAAFDEVFDDFSRPD